jgi:lysophospholipase L1-like esterase
LRIPVPDGRFGSIHINSRGFRGPEITVPKPPSTVRIAFLGASTTYCAEVSSNENVWPHLVTKALQSKWAEGAFDYVNGGVPGYTTLTSLKNLQIRIAPLQPDVIVIYEGHNDLSGNGLELAIEQGLASKPAEMELLWPAKYSLLWYLVEKNLLIMRNQQTALQAEGKLRIDRDKLDGPFRRDLRELVAASQRSARLVVLVTLTYRLRKDQSPQEKKEAAVTNVFYMPYISADGLIDVVENYNDVIREVANEKGTLLVEGDKGIPGNKEYFADSVHFTDKGSQAQAERVSRVLIESKALQEIVEQKVSIRKS